MLPTPETSHIASSVYPPSEDSFLVLDVLSMQHEYLRRRFPLPQHSSHEATSSPSPFIVEIGTGSGVIAAFITAHALKLFGRPDVAVIAFDLNPDACTAAYETSRRACAVLGTADKHHKTEAVLNRGIFLDGVLSDMGSALRAGQVDVLVCNPPYVPTDELPVAPNLPDRLLDPTGREMSAFELESRYLDLAVSGGFDGMQMTARLLDRLSDLLNARGVAYILLCARNRPEVVMQDLRAKGWEVDKIGSSGRKGGIEKLCIIRIARQYPA